ncbi:uncharacterized protein LOC111943077 [Cyanistes caeruleus]|uniref:uncharacterized protein LOC111943077 n=1 Tax=Cyanistes caeruleus TaxID=156563 RepID=UPI000CDA99A1|nr:uncharacterized protein LOC111943077 [Cyanistes caeruleus]
MGSGHVHAYSFFPQQAQSNPPLNGLQVEQHSLAQPLLPQTGQRATRQRQPGGQGQERADANKAWKLGQGRFTLAIGKNLCPAWAIRYCNGLTGAAGVIIVARVQGKPGRSARAPLCWPCLPPWLPAWTQHSLRALCSQGVLCFCDITASGDGTLAGNCPQLLLRPRAQAQLLAERCPEPRCCWQSTMAAHGSSALLQLYVLLLLAHPLDPVSKPERSTGASPLLLEDCHLDESDPERIRWAARTFLLIDLLIIGMAMGWSLGKRIQRCWRERNLQSPSGRAGPRCHRRQGCPTELMQLLMDNRDLMRLLLRDSPQPTTKTAAKEGSDRRLRTSPQL